MKSLWNKVKKKQLESHFISAILLRLSLMPFFSHPDILKTYRRAFNIAFEQTSPFNYFLAIVPHSIEALTLKISSLLINQQILQQINFAATDITHINLLLYLMKLPYLLAEIVFWLVLLKSKKFSKKTWLWLLFNPILIYSIYLFGRYESFVLLFLLLFLLAAQKQKFFQTLLWLFTLIFTRFSLVLLLPGILFLKKKQLKKFLIKAIPLTLLGSLVILLFKPTLFNSFLFIFQGNHASYLFQAKLKIGLIAIPLFIIVLSLFLIKASSIFVNQLNFADKFCLFSVLILSSYYITSIFHPQYFSWIILPLAWLLDKYVYQPKAKVTKTVDLLQIFVLISYILIIFYWNSETTIGLLYPIFSSFSFVGFSANLMATLSNLGKIGLAASLTWLNLQLINSIKQNRVQP